MRKIFLTISVFAIFSLVLSASLMTPVFADDVTITPTTNVYISSLGITLTIDGITDSISVNDSTITLVTCAGCSVRIESSDSRVMNTDYPNTNSSCASSYSYINLFTTNSTTVVVTPTSDVCTYTSGGGGGGGTSITYPSDVSVVINSYDTETSSRLVDLTLSATNASKMQVSNNPDFSDVTEWEAYADTKSWTLTEGIGEKRVYARFESSSGGESSAVSDTIVLVEEDGEEEPEFGSSISGLIYGGLTKATNLSTTYYYGNDGKRYIFFNSKVYNSWYSDFSEVVSASSSQLSELPLGGLVTYRPGERMVKIQSDPKVYAVAKGGVLRWVKTEEIAEELYGQDWNQQIDDVPETLFFLPSL